MYFPFISCYVLQELLYWVSLHLKTFDILLDEGVYCKIIFFTFMHTIRIKSLKQTTMVASEKNGKMLLYMLQPLPYGAPLLSAHLNSRRVIQKGLYVVSLIEKRNRADRVNRGTLQTIHKRIKLQQLERLHCPLLWLWWPSERHW